MYHNTDEIQTTHSSAPQTLQILHPWCSWKNAGTWKAPGWENCPLTLQASLLLRKIASVLSYDSTLSLGMHRPLVSDARQNLIISHWYGFLATLLPSKLFCLLHRSPKSSGGTMPEPVCQGTRSPSPKVRRAPNTYRPGNSSLFSKGKARSQPKYTLL